MNDSPPKIIDYDTTRDEWLMNHPDEWPIWPILPVKQARIEARRRPDGMGFMVAIENRRWHVYLGLIHDLKPGKTMRMQLDSMDKLTYNGPHAIVADGWICD